LNIIFICQRIKS